jgi:hypothetical protein
VKVQLSSDHDIFFLFETVLNEDQYKVVQVSQGLHAEFTDFPQMLVKMLNNCTRPGSRYSPLFSPQSSFIGQFTLDSEESHGYIEFF